MPYSGGTGSWVSVRKYKREKRLENAIVGVLVFVFDAESSDIRYEIPMRASRFNESADKLAFFGD